MSWCAHVGLTLAKLHAAHELEIRELAPINAAILHIGAMIYATLPQRNFSHVLISRTLPLLQDIGCTHVIVCQVFHRRYGTYTKHMDLDTYNAKVDALNELLKSPPAQEHLSALSHIEVNLKFDTTGINPIWVQQFYLELNG